MSPTACAILACIALAMPAAAFSSADWEAGRDDRRRTVAVLDPVDVGFMSTRPLAADFLRKGLARSGRWEILRGDSSVARLARLGIDPGRPCKEFQCAFDAGSALQSEFVLFGTLASLRELQAYTLALLHVPTSQVVWSRAGDIPRRNGERPAQALESALGWAVEGMDPRRIDLRRVPTLGLMAMVDAGDGSRYSRVVKERAMAHVYASRNYDVIAEEEMHELLKALDIEKPADRTPDQEILDIGARLDVRYVMSTRLTRSDGAYRLRLALHDLSGGKAVRKWPSRDVDDFQTLLRVEDRFFSALGDPDLPAGPAIPRPSPVRVAGKYASVALALATGAGLGYLAYEAKRGADGQFRRFQSARSQEEAAAARQRTLEEDVQAKRYGLLSGVCLVLGAAVWTF